MDSLQTKERKYYVYRFFNKDNVITYVGRTIDLYKRFLQHDHLTDEVAKIEYIECDSEAEMAWKEVYYINLYYNCNRRSPTATGAVVNGHSAVRQRPA